MDKIKVASPLFILRNECENDLFSVLARLQEIGYDGCELLGFFGHEPGLIARYLQGANWTAMGNHVPYDQFEADFEAVLGDHLQIGCSYITIQLPPERMPGGADYDETIAKVEQWSTALAAKGITLLYHNHAGEFANRVQ